MNYNFSDDQKILKNTIHKFCEKELNREYVRWMDENCTFLPDNIWKKLADLGLFGLTVPVEYGGSGQPYANFLIAMDEIATASTSAAFCVFCQVGFGARFMALMGNEAQKKYHLPKVVTGENRYCMALTEPDGGTDILGAMRTKAVKNGDSYIINGQKMFITSAQVADYIFVVCITNPEAKKRADAISIFIIDAKTPGITINMIPKSSCHFSAACEIAFEDVKVPAENLMGELNGGWDKLVDILNPERMVVGAISLGIIKAAYKLAKEYSLQRTAFGKPIGSFQILQKYMIDMLIGIENTENLMWKCCDLMERGIPYHNEALMLRIVSSAASEQAAVNAVKILGGYGNCMEYDAQRYFRDFMMAGPITPEMAYNMLARWNGFPRCY